MNEYTSPAVAFVTNSTVATPFASVVDVEVENVSPVFAALAL